MTIMKVLYTSLLFFVFFLFLQPIFGAEQPSLNGQEEKKTDQYSDKQCAEGESKGNLFCAYSPLEEQCVVEKEKVIVATANQSITRSQAEIEEEQQVKKMLEDIALPKTLRQLPARKPIVINAPKPYVYKTENGRKVCNRKNDHPGKSKKGKRYHMDMECCLDPDEYPNPHCYYPPEKYGKYLNNRPK